MKLSHAARLVAGGAIGIAVVMAINPLVAHIRGPLYAAIWYLALIAVCYQLAFGSALERLYAELGISVSPSHMTRMKRTARALSVTFFAIATVVMILLAAQALGLFPAPCSN